MKIELTGNQYLDYYKENDMSTFSKTLKAVKDSIIKGQVEASLEVEIPKGWESGFIAIDPDGTMCIYQQKPVAFDSPSESSIDNSSWDIHKIEHDFVDFAKLTDVGHISNWKDLCLPISGDLSFVIK